MLVSTLCALYVVVSRLGSGVVYEGLSGWEVPRFPGRLGPASYRKYTATIF